MGIFAMIQRWNERKKVKSEKFKEMQEDYRLNKILEERQKSANERELERYFEEQRQIQITEQLKKIRAQKNHEMWKGNNFGGKATMLKDDRPILKEKNIFIDHRNDIPLTKKQEMFFKW